MPIAIRLFQRWPEAAQALSALKQAGFTPDDLRLLGRREAARRSRASAVSLAGLLGVCLGGSLGVLLIVNGWQPRGLAQAEGLAVALGAAAVGLFALLACLSVYRLLARRQRQAMRGRARFALIVTACPERQLAAWEILSQASGAADAAALPRPDHKWGGLMVFDSPAAAKEGERSLRRRGFVEEVNHAALYAT